VRLAQALGAQVAISIENARLSSETTTRLEELMTINSLSQAISSTLKLVDMLPIIKEQVPLLTGAEEMYLALYDPDTHEITFPLAVRQGEAFYLAPRPLGTDEVSYIIKRKHTLSLGADYFSPAELRRSMGITSGEGDALSYMGVPVKSGDQVLGVLAIRNRERSRAFSLNDDRVLSTVGSQLGAAIQNARLFERIEQAAAQLEKQVHSRTEELELERDRLDTLYQITAELARTLDMEQLLDRALGMVSKAVGAQDGVIMLSDPATDRLFCRAWLNPDHLRYEADSQTPTHPAEGLATWLIQHSEITDHVIVVNDLHEHKYWDIATDGQTGLRSALGVILESNEDPMGVMVLLGATPGMFTENHLKLLVPAANQVAAAINSADLYQLIRDQAERLGKLLRGEQEEAQKHSAIVESIADGVLLADSTGTIVLFNSAAERILQLPREQAIGQPVMRLAGLYGASAVRWMQMIQDWTESLSISAEEMPESFVSEQIELGDKIVSTQLSPVYIGDSFLGTVSVFRDVTKDVESDRAKSKFIENVSHEFRTPLTPIKGYTDLLLMGAGGSLSEMQSSFLNVIKDNVDRLTVLVNDVLNIAKIQNRNLLLNMQMIDLSEIIPPVVEQHASRSVNQERQLQVTTYIAPGLPRLRADRESLLKIISNVVDNAFKYTLPGGKIDIAAAVEANGQFILITVADTGVGIPLDFRDKAWQRFERYQEHALQLDIAGTGLGLPLVKELVELHHGAAWFESEVNQGTTFFIRLPLEQPNYVTESMSAVQVSPMNHLHNVYVAGD
jgi:PAS domain S-box-containing protein